MARINAGLLAKIRKKSGLSLSRVYALIDAAAMAHTQPKNVAALLVAGNYGVNFFKYATAEELSALQTIRSQSPNRSLPAPQVAVSDRADTRPASKRRALAPRSPKKRENAVFVVHGRDLEARNNLSILLRSLNVDVIEWEKALELTKKANPYIREVIDAGFAHAQAIVVLLTPDDEAKLRPAFARRGDPTYEKRPMGQPRQNVLFEAGLAFGKYEKNTVLVQIGRVRPMSDIAGIHILNLTGSVTSRKQLVGKLKMAGVRYDDSGADWLTQGDFTSGA